MASTRHPLTGPPPSMQRATKEVVSTLAVCLREDSHSGGLCVLTHGVGEVVVIHNSALASSVLGSLCQGPRVGFALHLAHLQSERHAWRTGGRRVPLERRPRSTSFRTGFRIPANELTVYNRERAKPQGLLPPKVYIRPKPEKPPPAHGRPTANTLDRLPKPPGKSLKHPKSASESTEIQFTYFV